jgi:DedD protein
MVQPVVTRSQRRVERKQVGLVIVLILAVAGISFALGLMFGQKDKPSPGMAVEVEKPKLPLVTKVAPPPPPVVVEKPEQLTFYDTLPKGNQAPLGSGINLPPEKVVVLTEVKKKEVAKPVSLPPEAQPKPTAAPAVSMEGAFVVQVASFSLSDDAKKMASHLKEYKLTTFVESVDLGNKGVWHRVLVGPYASREAADQAADLLQKKERLSALVRQR